ncbi:MAG: cobalamin-dependent protein [Acidimicrobiales bacterium]
MGAVASSPAAHGGMASATGEATPSQAAVERVVSGQHRKVLVSKVGLDGHDRGVRVVGRILRDAGFEVVYGGLQQTPEMVVATARDEDVELVGLSLHSGAHMTLVPMVLQGLAAEGLDVPLVVGGIIPDAHAAELRRLGVAAVLSPGASAETIVNTVAGAIDAAQAGARETRARHREGGVTA